jgi:hypothetical protein
MQFVLPIFSLAVATIVWSIRLEGRVNTTERLSDQRFSDLEKLLNAKFDAVGDRLERIERTLNGTLTKH